MMLYTGRDQDTHTGDRARAVREERRTFARRIDCDSSPRQAASYAPSRGGASRGRDEWERSRRGYGS
jgi:hypothetical protein